MVERLLPLVVTTAKTCSSMTADCIDFVNEHYRRRDLLGLFEQVSYSGGADTDKHLDEL